ncbi:hypothetical protein RRG08_036860 [Elysia crispata]|uniref:Reverse transcriptase domain-containing protein n=1 Tax=Elysia crispata TaxID=231223 RepID=A0AAE1AWX0_9GAST|nr:hypothetical protein RRG08_036860 [Elysia crispata]
MCRKEQHSKRTPKPNIAAIVNKEESQRRYQNTLDTKLSSITSDRKNNTDNSKARADSVPDRLKCVQTIIKQSIEESVGCVATARQNKHNDEELSQLSKRQKDIRVKIQNTKDNNKRDRLKIERNRILHTIRKRQIKLKNEEIEKKIEDINSAKCDHAIFKATRLLYQKQFENPKVEDQEGKLASNPNDILDIVSSHFKSKFEDEKVEEITPFEGEPKPLKSPITPEEVRKKFNSLSNNKAPGEDQIHAELLKYGTPLLDQTIADIFNTLLEEYLSKSQSGFRPDRSTADVVWTHKWLAAKTLKEDVIIKISGIDMSAAFDTIDRNQLLNIIATIVNEDELRIIRFLLSNTKIKTRINGATKTNTFISNVGTPQGDSLSPVLFIVYLEHALKEVRTTLPRPIVKYEKEIPNEIAYADDVDFIGQDYVNINEIQETLHKYQLKVNTDKTEFTALSKNEEDWKNAKKVGSLIGDLEDVERRKQLSTAALNKLYHVWMKGNKLKTTTKIQLYKSLVKSILLYNCSTWALTLTEEEKINAFHRKQLKKVLNIKFPVKITNKSLYKKCQEKPLSLQILKARWNLFGHILRRDSDIPANRATRAYFIQYGHKLRGRPTTTLPIVLNRDLGLIDHFRLHSTDDLVKITELAKDRKQWRQLSARIEKAAEASQTVNWDATRQ